MRERAGMLWETYDRPARDSAPELVYIDLSKEGQLRHRYEMENHRMMHRALAELARSRAGLCGDAQVAEPAPPEPPPAVAEAPARNEPNPSAPEPVGERQAPIRQGFASLLTAPEPAPAAHPRGLRSSPSPAPVSRRPPAEADLVPA